MAKRNGAVAPFVKVMSMKVHTVTRHAVLAAIATALLSSCAAIDRVKNIGQPPPLAAVDNPTARPGYKPVQMPMPAAQPASYNPNSLWRNGSRAFFKDQRAHQIGDILTANSTASSDGKGSVNRQEALSTNVAGVVTQVLPNGNLVIEGRQEIRVNFEIRELIVAGIVRPEDIQSDNTIDSSKIAQARIAYGGRGQITDVQQPRYGQQVLDVVLPF